MSTVFAGYKTKYEDLGKAIKELKKIYTEKVRNFEISYLQQCGIGIYYNEDYSEYCLIAPFGFSRGGSFGNDFNSDVLIDCDYDNRTDVDEEEIKNLDLIDNLLCKENLYLRIEFNNIFLDNPFWKVLKEEFFRYDCLVYNSDLGTAIEYEKSDAFGLEFKIGQYTNYDSYIPDYLSHYDNFSDIDGFKFSDKSIRFNIPNIDRINKDIIKLKYYLEKEKYKDIDFYEERHFMYINMSKKHKNKIEENYSYTHIKNNSTKEEIEFKTNILKESIEEVLKIKEKEKEEILNKYPEFTYKLSFYNLYKKYGVFWENKILNLIINFIEKYIFTDFDKIDDNNDDKRKLEYERLQNQEFNDKLTNFLIQNL